MIFTTNNSNYLGTGLGKVLVITPDTIARMAGFSAATQSQIEKFQIFRDSIPESVFNKISNFFLPRLAANVDEAFWNIATKARNYPDFYKTNSSLPSSEGYYFLASRQLKVDITKTFVGTKHLITLPTRPFGAVSGSVMGTQGSVKWIGSASILQSSVILSGDSSDNLSYIVPPYSMKYGGVSSDNSVIGNLALVYAIDAAGEGHANSKNIAAVGQTSSNFRLLGATSAHIASDHAVDGCIHLNATISAIELKTLVDAYKVLIESI